MYTFNLLAGEYPYDYNGFQFLGPDHPPDLEDSWYESAHYRHHFVDRWVSDNIEIITPDATESDILDLFNIHSDIETCSLSVEEFSAGEGAFITNKTGPIRSIRSYLGAKSGVFTQRTHLFYSKREDIVTDLRVHRLGPQLTDYMDLSEDAKGMIYYSNYVTDGEVVDGESEPNSSVEMNPAEFDHTTSWQLITGEQGSLVSVFKIESNIDYRIALFYRDQAIAKPECGGDGLLYGAHGIVFLSSMPCTDIGCENYLHTVRTVYFDEEEASTDLAKKLSQNVYTPVTILLRPIEN